ncbi:MAG: nucleotidyltransferase family protein [Bacteroidetes bacterium]|nr:nucleotidyltransferase family protein [Bacteroidota bacterium]
MEDKQKLSKYIVSHKATLKDAINQLDAGGEKILFVVNHDNKLFGALTDGDLRRFILSDGDFKTTVENVCNKKPIKILEPYDLEKIKRLIIEKKLSAVPVVNDCNVLVDILFWEEIFDSTEHRKPKSSLSNPVVIMAGGKGTRLDPFTKILPKPLIPIGDKPIIEIIIDKFVDYGVNDFYLTLNHKSKIIKSYFEELSPSFNVEFVLEDSPYGTAGSINLLKGRFSEPVIVTNCDIIIDCDYHDFVTHHTKNKFDLTLAASLKNYKIPYGICELSNGGVLEKIVEKPEYNYLVNTGMYVLNPDMIKLIPEKKHFDMTDFMEVIKSSGGKVGVYPISESSWIDTGEWAEYKKAVQKISF